MAQNRFLYYSFKTVKYKLQVESNFKLRLNIKSQLSLHMLGHWGRLFGWDLGDHRLGRQKHNIDDIPIRIDFHT